MGVYQEETRTHKDTWSPKRQEANMPIHTRTGKEKMVARDNGILHRPQLPHRHPPLEYDPQGKRKLSGWKVP